MNSQEFAHSNRFICGKPVVTWCKLWCKLSAKSRLYAVILTYTPSISPAASLSGNYDLNGQRSASPCWPSVVAQQRLNRPRLKVCDSLLFTILSLAHALAYAAYTAKYRLHLRFVRICLPFTYSLYHFFSALLLEISTEPIRSILQKPLPVWQILYRAFWSFAKCETSFRNMVSPTPTVYSLFRHSTVIRNFLNRLSHSTFHHSSNLPISRLAYTTRATVTSFFSSSTHSELIVKYLEEKNPSIPISTLV